MSKNEIEREKLEKELWHAAIYGPIQRVTRLIQQGVDVNCADALGVTPLHWAALGGHVGVAELLLEAGARVDSTNRHEETPLHSAASGGHVGVAELLLEAGAPVDSKDRLGVTPLHNAASGGHVGVAELLLEAGAPVDSMGLYRATPLHKAASGGHVGVAELLLKAGARVDSWALFEATPLHEAASGGHVGVAELLMKAGARVDSRTRFGATPLLYAASGGHVGVAELLLKAGAWVDSGAPSGATPLHKAATGGHAGVAELLLKAGARVDSKDWRGETPGDIAAGEDAPKLMQHEKDRILEGRKRILELFAAVKMAGPYRRIVRKVGPEGGELQTGFCTITVPPGAVTMETEITCQVINPNDVTLPLKEEEMLLSDVIELGPHGTTFHQPVTVQMQYSSASSGGDMEAVVWVTEDRLQWTELTTIEKSEDKLTVSVNHFSIFAVISQPKQDKFTVPTEECMLTSSTQPAVQVKFPKGSVNTDTQVILQVQDVPERAINEIKAKDESFNGLLSTSPIVYVETVSDSKVQFHKPVTLRVPHPQHYMDIQHEGDTKLRVMSCEEGTEDWTDVTDIVTNIRVTKEFVEFGVSHFTRWNVIVLEDIYDDSEELGPIPLNLCRWLQHRAVQFILLQKKDNIQEILIECKPVEDAEAEHTKLMQRGYKGPLPSDSVNLFEGQKVEVRFLGNVSITSSCTQQHLTFHSQGHNRLQMQVKGRDGSDGSGTAVFFALPRVKVRKEKNKNVKIRSVRKKLEKLGHPFDTDDLQPEKLCELPIFVPCETTQKTKGASGGATLKDVGKHFYFIKEEVSTDWKDLAFQLGLKRADIANIAGRNRDDKSRCMDMLQEWKKLNGDAATTDVLMEALSDAGLQSVVDGLDAHLTQMGRHGQTSTTKEEEEEDEEEDEEEEEEEQSASAVVRRVFTAGAAYVRNMFSKN